MVDYPVIWSLFQKLTQNLSKKCLDLAVLQSQYTCVGIEEHAKRTGMYNN